jgi:hypothetical protein
VPETELSPPSIAEVIVRGVLTPPPYTCSWRGA